MNDLPRIGKLTPGAELMQNVGAVQETLKKVLMVFSEDLPWTKWTIHAGTALAAWHGRDKSEGGTVLWGDCDLDFAVLSETCSPEDLIYALEKAGFKRRALLHYPNHHNLGVIFSFRWKKMICDFYFLYRRGVRRWWGNFPGGINVLPAYLFDNPEPMKLLGIELPTPSPLIAYCCCRWMKVGDRFPWEAQGGVRISRVAADEFQVYDDQEEVRAAYEKEHGKRILEWTNGWIEVPP